MAVLSAADPVRLFQQFATLDLISEGRAEMVVGRGSSIEAFPLFGYDLNDYDALFAEKLDLLLNVRANEQVTWSGEFRPSLDRARASIRDRCRIHCRSGWASEARRIRSRVRVCSGCR